MAWALTASRLEEFFVQERSCSISPCAEDFSYVFDTGLPLVRPISVLRNMDEFKKGDNTATVAQDVNLSSFPQGTQQPSQVRATVRDEQPPPYSQIPPNQPGTYNFGQPQGLWNPQGKALLTNNNQRLEMCVRCVLLPNNWYLRVFFWLTTNYRHGHNLVLLKFTIKQLEKFILSGIDRYEHDIEAKGPITWQISETSAQVLKEILLRRLERVSYNLCTWQDNETKKFHAFSY